jgi:hypothetical protein
LNVMALYCFLFTNKLHPLPLPVGIIVTIWMIQLHHYFFSMIVVISHRFWCFFGTFLILLHSASLVLLSCLLGFISLFSLFSIVFTLWARYQYVCIVCYTFNKYLTTLFDVYCMLSQSIHCMHNLPTKCILHLASHLYQYV